MRGAEAAVQRRLSRQGGAGPRARMHAVEPAREANVPQVQQVVFRYDTIDLAVLQVGVRLDDAAMVLSPAFNTLRDANARATERDRAPAPHFADPRDDGRRAIRDAAQRDRHRVAAGDPRRICGADAGLAARARAGLSRQAGARRRRQDRPTSGRSSGTGRTPCLTSMRWCWTSAPGSVRPSSSTGASKRPCAACSPSTRTVLRR